MSGTAPCQIPNVVSPSGRRVSTSRPSTSSNRHTSTAVASGAKIAKFVLSGPHVAPSGSCRPGHTRLAAGTPAAAAAGRSSARVTDPLCPRRRSPKPEVGDRWMPPRVRPGGSTPPMTRLGPTSTEDSRESTVGEFVRLEVEGGVGTIRVDRPKMNALNVQVQEEIRAAATQAAERDDVRAVIVYGGERVFAAGADIKEMADMSYTDMVQRSGGLQSAFTAVARIPKPVVAAVTGYALGGGCELALCADIRVAGEGATFGQPEVLLGVIPGAGGTQRLSRLVGPSRAKDLIFTGRFV